jgi:hypothetical protein
MDLKHRGFNFAGPTVVYRRVRRQPGSKDRIAMAYRLGVKQRAEHRRPLTFEFAVFL